MSDGKTTIALDQDLPQLVQRSLALYRELADALVTSAEDCGAATAKLGQLATRYRDVVRSNAKIVRDGRIKELRAALDPYNDAFDRSAQAIVGSPTMAACAQSAGFARALDALFDPPP